MRDFLKYTAATVTGIFIFATIGFFLFIFMLAAVIATFSTSSSTIPTTLSEHSVYVLDLKGSVVERSETDEFESALMTLAGEEPDPEYGLNDILANIRFAKENDKVAGIYLRGGELSMGSTTALAIREALLDFKESGKFIVAYADSYGQNSYYLASCADRLMVNPSGMLDWHGVAVNIEFYSRLLEKIGVEMQVVKVGTFKSAVEPYILTEMSEANRLQYDVLAGDLWTEILAGVSASRNISIDTLNLLADRYMAVQPQEDYVASGLVDTLCYAQDVKAVLEQYTGTEDYKLVSHKEMSAAVQPTLTKAKKVAVVYAEGEITDDKGDGIVGKDMVKLIDELEADSSIAAVVLRVNSPGGSAYASEQIHHALTLLHQQKPIVVSMGDYAASGGYYISCCADYIFAEKTTLTGSIGIFGLIPNVKGLADWAGLDFDGVKTNKHGDFDTNMILRGMNPEERAMMQAEINRGYDLFTRRCAEGRNMSQDSIKVIGEGRVWSGLRAMQIGLVDEMGNLKDAIEAAAVLANVEDYEVADYPEPVDEWEEFINMCFSSARLVLSPSFRTEKLMENRMGKQAYRALRSLEQISEKPTIQAAMPYVIEIK